MSSKSCPTCDETIEVPELSVTGEIITCKSCGDDFELDDNLDLKPAESVGEDWGEGGPVINGNFQKLCDCGCMELIWHKSHGRVMRFKAGHSSRGSNNPMFGKSPMLGKKLSEEAKQKIRISKMGERNPAWKGDNVGYSKLHKWVRKYLPIPELCQECELIPPYDLANVTGIYNRDFSNWQYLCRFCHRKDDGKSKEIIIKRFGKYPWQPKKKRDPSQKTLTI